MWKLIELSKRWIIQTPCSRAQSSSLERYKTKFMAKLPRYVAKSGQPWTTLEVKQLKSMGGKVPTRVIGLKLQRPVAGVQAKAQEMGMSLKPVNKSPRSKLK